MIIAGSRSGRGRDKKMRFEDHAVSKKDLAGCLATLSEMAHTGSGVATESDPGQSRQPAPDAIKVCSRFLLMRLITQKRRFGEGEGEEESNRGVSVSVKFEGVDT